MKNLRKLFLLSLVLGPLSGLVAQTTPAVTTGSATNLTMSSVTLSGTVSPNGSQTTDWFQYGTTAGYGSITTSDTIDDHSNTLLFNDADSNEVVIPSGIDLSNSAFTIEAWAKRYPNGSYDYILGQGPTTPRSHYDLQFGFRNTASGNVFTFGFYNDDLNTPAGYTDTLWHQWVGVFDYNGYGGGNRYIYRDGTLVASDVPIISYFGTGQIIIGNSTFNTSDYFSGEIDQVRIWNVALDSSTIRAWMNRNVTSSHPNYSNLVGEWILNEGGGTVAGDSINHSYDGTIERATWASSDWSASIQVSVTGLVPNTTYHFRLSANNAAGLQHGNDLTFTTLLSTPTAQTSDLNFSNISEHAATISWTNGNGQADLVLVKTGTTTDNTNVPVNESVYSADTVYGAGSQLGTNGYVVYLGSSNSVTISGLLSGQNYAATVYAVNNPTTSPEYDTTLHPVAGFQTTTPATFIPVAVTGSATTITDTTATLNGNITTSGSQAIVYFNYGKTTEYGSVSTKDTIDDQESALLLNSADSTDVICGGSNYLLFTEFTVEAWAKRYPNGKYNTIVSAGYAHVNSGLQFGFRDSANGNVFTFGFYDDDLNSPVGYTDTLWHQWVGVLGNNYNRYLYRDGVLVAHDVAAEFYPNPSGVIIGRDVYDNNSYFNGKIANVRLWDAALDSTTIRNWMYRHITNKHPYYSNLIAEWRLDEGSGIMAGDSSGNGDNGTIYNATWTNGTSSDSLDVSSAITGLTPNTTYHYRITATNSAGPAVGSDLTFFTGPPTVQASDIVASQIERNSFTIRWTNGNGQSRVVLMKKDTTIGSPLPVDGTIYASSSIFGGGALIGTGVYVVYDGTGDSVTVTGLTRGNYYTAAVFEMDNASSSPTYLTSGPATATLSTIAPNYSTKPGTALHFAGNGFLNAGDSSDFNFVGAFTLEGWIKVDSFTTDWQAIVTKGDNAWRVQRYGSTDNLDFGTNGLSIQDQQGTVNVNDGKWHFIAAVYDGTSKILYVDGKVDAESVVTGTLSTDASPVYIGENADNTGRQFYGSMDEIRVWNLARSEQQVRKDMFTTTSGAQYGLVSYWQLNEGSGSTAADSVSGNNAIINGSLSWATSDAPVGGYGSYNASTSTDSVGGTGVNVITSITSPADSLDFLGLYSYGSPADSTVTNEIFPSGVNKRWPVIWGIFGVGYDTANVTLNYGGLSGIQNEAGLKVLEREEADSPWTDVTSNFAQNKTNHTFVENGMHLFSQFAIGATTDNSLPVQATDFLATANISSVTLSWKTQSEVDNAGFNILREDPSTSSFKVISSYTLNDSLKGVGTSSIGRSYDFTDNKVISGDTYTYRIQSVSTDGTKKDLSTLTVTVDVPKAYALYQNYPNPFNPSTTIRFDLKEQSTVALDIYSVLGQKIFEENYGTMNAGRFNEIINMSGFASGLYFYRISAIGKDGQRFASIKKFMLIK